MNHHPTSKPEPLLPELVAELARIRAARAFDASWYITEKVNMIATYLKTHKLKAAVLGLSGGIDSAVVLGLLREVKRLYPEVLVKIVPVAMPARVTGATGQMVAWKRALRLCRAWDVSMMTYSIRSMHDDYCDTIETELTTPKLCSILGEIPPDKLAWARGQLVSYLRTPALYYTTSLLTAQGQPAVVVGTTNRDEGSYLGYVGKASDGMVDLQVIADLHKSEVRAVAKVLRVTQEILDIAPTGDMYDGRVDEEVFGAPYDFVELYLNHRCQQGGRIQGCWFKSPCRTVFSDEAIAQYDRLADSLEALHSHNAHKYLVGSPAVHLNVLSSAVPGGWEA